MYSDWDYATLQNVLNTTGLKVGHKTRYDNGTPSCEGTGRPTHAITPHTRQSEDASASSLRGRRSVCGAVRGPASAQSTVSLHITDEIELFNKMELENTT